MIQLALVSSLLFTQPVAYAPVQIGGLNDGVEFSGGPYAGLNIGKVVTPDGKSFRGLLPSRLNASPVNKKNVTAVESFIAGYEHPERAPLVLHLGRRVKMENCRVQGEECDSAPVLPILFGEPVRANSPYQLADGAVRIEWLYGSALYYLTTLRFSHGKIVHVRTQPAWLPNG